MNNKKKRYRIKNRFRFVVFIIAVMLVSVSGINTILGINEAASLTVQDFLSVEISAGDTLWNIANEYMPSDMDTRRAVHKICVANNISADEIYPGQILLIPVYN